jgi:hexosaminidase
MKISAFLTFFSLLISLNSLAQELVPVIPQPVKVTKNTGQFVINKHTVIAVETELLKPLAHYLQKELLKTQHLPLSIGTAGQGSAIRLALNNKRNEGAEGYVLDIRPGDVLISAKESSGIFYGIISLLQIVRQAKTQNGTLLVEGWKVEDKPAFSWRGMMLDESRHFFGIRKVKSLLDWMAFYKLNRLHWHLTDEPAWRLEIKKYPKLAIVGGIGNYLNENAPALYYTQEDIKEVVAYAAERRIIVIPEIDMPGHASAANRAYPEFTGGGAPGHPDFTFHPGKEITYTYLTNILRETNALFPAGMIHLGGDEVSYGNQKWAADAAIAAIMKRNNLADIKDVETYFMKRMGDSLFKMNSRLLVWDEMADAGLPKDKTIIFWWRHDKPAQLKSAIEKGYAVVACPRLPFYFDFVQDSTHTYGRKWGEQYNSLQSVYSFSLQNTVGTMAETKILGIQANLWTETVENEYRLDYLLFPRITALAEAAWTQENRKDFSGFMNRLKGHITLFQQERLYYFDPFSPGKNPEPVRIGMQPKRFNTEE